MNDRRQERLFPTTVGGDAATAELAYQVVGDRRRSKSLKLAGGWPIPRSGRGGVFGACSGVRVGWWELISFGAAQRIEFPTIRMPPHGLLG